MTAAEIRCPLCIENGATSYHQDARRVYLRCPNCALIFVPVEYHLSLVAEKAAYDRHENSPADPRYRQFLERLFLPLNQRLPPAGVGLDFGSGPGPTLSVMGEEAGHQVAIYDPFYAPDRAVLMRHYDFVTATEVIEHFRRPRASLWQLWELVKPNGFAGLMTKRADAQVDFGRWHYIRDPTHVAFYSAATFRWLAQTWSASLTLIGTDVIILQKSPDERRSQTELADRRRRTRIE